MMAPPWPESRAVRLLQAAALGALVVASLDFVVASVHGALPQPGWFDTLLLLPSSFGALLSFVVGPVLLVSLVLERLPRPAGSWLSAEAARPALLVLGFVLCLAGLIRLSSLSGQSLGKGWGLCVLFVTILCAGLLLQQLGASWLGGRLAAWASKGWGVAALLLMLGGLLLPHIRPSLQIHLLRRTPAAAGVIIAWQGLSDLDGDGYGGLWAGPDCAPFDESMHPGALDEPANARDEDCVGGDATLDDVSSVEQKAALPSGVFSGRSVVLVTIESLRADRMGVAGARRLVTPALDLLVERSTLLGRAYANSPERLGALHGVLTGRQPPSLAKRRDTGSSAPEKGLDETQSPKGASSPATLAQLLSASGYEAMAVLSKGFPESGPLLRRGFSRVKEAGEALAESAPVTADWAVREAVAVTEEFRGRRYLLWLHLADPSPPFVFHGGTPFFGNRESDRYDGEVAYTDAQLGVLLDHLEKSGQLSNTVVVVVGTQGISFGEGRAAGLGEDRLRVPLVFWLPGIPAKRLSARVEGVDVTPTLLDLLGMEAPVGLSGQSLVPLMFNDEKARRRPDVLAEYSSGRFQRRALIHEDLKLVEDPRYGTVELYDLAKDPEERHDIAWRVPELPQLRRRLAALGARRHKLYPTQ